MTEAEMVRLIVAEMRAGELLDALRDACNSAPGWRQKTSALLDDINNGVLRPTPERAA
jgi:hypothetical protein